MKRFLSRNWIIPWSLVLGSYVGLPFLAPIFMRIGWNEAARVVYFIYSLQCHQLPERSFFLFGAKLTYPLAEIQNAWQNSVSPAVLRQFIGNAAMGWKVAWSDRMVSMYTSIWMLGILWWPIRKKLKKLPLWGLVLFLLPMGIDGISHLFSDISGISQGFRYENVWLADLTQHIFKASFYAGEAWGSFNSLMRLLTGILFGIGIVWYTYPYMDKAFAPQSRTLAVKAVSDPTNQLSGMFDEYKK